MKYYIITFGCQMNEADSERIASTLERMDHRPVSKINEADLIVVNMCSVRQSAVDRVYGLINQKSKIKNQNDNSKFKIILTGCILQTDKKKLKNQVDFILNIKDLPNWPKLLSRVFYGRRKYATSNENYLRIKPKYSNNFSAFIPVSTGCDNFCSYCVVPFARGPLVCRDHEEILKEIEIAAKKGFKEVWLLGQNVNRYRSILKISPPHQNLVWGQENQKSKIIDFANLLEMINDISGNFWIRFTSPNPADFSDKLIKIMAKCKKITPYLNLPLQSGDNQVLKKMNRKYTVFQYKNLVKKIRAAFKKYRTGLEKNITISTDIIVGFPGETRRQFKNTVKLFKGINCDMAYIAQYSPRPETAAAKMEDIVSKQKKEKRWKILTGILKKTALKKNKKFVGKTVEVLVEKSKNGFFLGKSQHYKTVKIATPCQKPNLVGKVVKVKIIEALIWRLKGKIQKN